MITDLGHAAFRVHDLDRALAFYARLGIHEAFRLHHEDGSLMLVYLHIAGDRFIELFPGGAPPDPERRASFMHLCSPTISTPPWSACAPRGCRSIASQPSASTTTGRPGSATPMATRSS